MRERSCRPNNNLPDFTELVHKDLSKELSPCFPGTAKLIFEQVPLTDKPEGATDVLLTVSTAVILSDGDGLRTLSMIQLTDPAENILWKKRYRYVSTEFDRTGDLEALEANGGKLLHEEIAHAAQRTVADFVKDFKGGTVSPQKESGSEDK